MKTEKTTNKVAINDKKSVHLIGKVSEKTLGCGDDHYESGRPRRTSID